MSGNGRETGRGPGRAVPRGGRGGLLAGALAAFFGLAAAAPAGAGQVIVNVWDGADFTVVRALHRDGMLPHLAALGPLRQLTALTPCEGERCQHGRTKDQHATMLTGSAAADHGVWGNMTTAPVPEGMTLFERLRERLPTIRLAFLSGKCSNVGPRTFANALGAIDVFEACPEQGRHYSPEEVAGMAALLAGLWGGEDFLIFAHFYEPDHTGHRFGVESRQYRQALVHNDELLGALLAAAPGAQAVVLGDHGFGTLNLHNGRARGRDHDSHSPGTFAAGVPRNLYMDEVAGIVEAAAAR